VPFLRTAIALRPDNADAHYVLGTILRQEGALDEALTELREAVRHRPESPDAHLSIGQILQQKRDAAGAAAAFAEAERLSKIKADAQAATLAVGVGKKRLEAGDRAGAVERFREAVRLDSGNAQAHYELALALRGQGAESEARSHFAEAQRLAPYLIPPQPRD
jgi:tetratricopeptide (TPR) repeat protein